jgi:thiamine biosynthesis lipoprotein
LVVLLAGCGRQIENPSFTGQTMGTVYSVRLVGRSVSQQELDRLKEAVDARLQLVNNRMSTYIPDSEISRFNASRQTDPIAVSSPFSQVVRAALTLAGQTGGAFDPTVGPLVDLWGFGPSGRVPEPPAEQDLLSARARVGYERLKVVEHGALRKTHPDLEIDLGGIAKGYGVDVMTELLNHAGWTNVLVEIGGETRTLGRNADGRPWRIGVQRPDYGALPGARIEGILHVSGLSVATSGDYQNFYRDKDGTVRAHIVDPRTGYPVEHALASVTVVAETCMEADGLATGFYVLGPVEGLALVESLPDVEALFIERVGEQAFRETASSGFERRTKYEILTPE